MLRTDARIVEAGRDRMRADDLAVVVGHHVGAVAVQHAGLAGRQRRGMAAGLDAVTTGFDAVHLHAVMRNERVEQADRIAAAADAGDERIRQAAEHGLRLRDDLAADDGVEVAHEHRVRVWTGDGADHVEGVVDIRDPVAQRLVERILERLGAALHRHHFGAEQLHAVDVRALALHVVGAHVDHALEAEARRDRGAGHAVLAGAGLGDDARLAEVLREQRLADRVVDLVRARVVQVLALEEDLRATPLLAQALGRIQRRRTADVEREVLVELGTEGGVVLELVVGRLELAQRLHERFGDETTAIRAEVASGVRQVFVDHPGMGVQLEETGSAAETSRTKARILPESLMPGAASIPLLTSTA